MKKLWWYPKFIHVTFDNATIRQRLARQSKVSGYSQDQIEIQGTRLCKMRFKENKFS